ncbi:S-adenosyl-L-methionine-dependent methyltransferase [Auriculariales sp. MPI-PUGE-AT-0066]|nr:S-adenosyl-L-methionine-dependent methyltransferase [Auriculariales sp. MPI-PUGE-AT-0066]
MASGAPVKAGGLIPIIAEHGEAGWDVAWKKDFTPWEVKEQTQPALKDLLNATSLPFEWPKGGKALVPGCGRGYDAVLIADTLGLDVLGVDLSETAVQAARDHYSKSGSSARVTYESGDFFARAAPADKYDLVYDFTFFVAIPPALRPGWGAQVNAHLKQDGLLIILAWPLHTTKKDGPPYALDPALDDYAKVLDVEGAVWQRLYEKDATEETMIGRVDGATAKIVVWRKMK